MKDLEDLGQAEAMPKMEKRRMNVMIQPKKSAKSASAKRRLKLLSVVRNLLVMRRLNRRLTLPLFLVRKNSSLLT